MSDRLPTLTSDGFLRGPGSLEMDVDASDISTAIYEYLSKNCHGRPRILLENLHVRGPLNWSGLLSQAEQMPALRFRKCSFDDPLALNHAQLQALHISECRMPGINARRVKVDDDITLNGVFSSTGLGAYVDFYGSRVGGSLRVKGSCRFSGEHGTNRGFGLDLSGMRVEGDIGIEGHEPGGNGRYGFCVYGGIGLQNTAIGGDLFATHVYCAARGRGLFGIDLSGIQIVHSCTLRGMLLHGALRLGYGRIGTWAELTDLSIKSTRKADPKEIGNAIDAPALRVEGDFSIGPCCRFDGKVNLRGANIAATLWLNDFKLSIEQSASPPSRETQVFALDASNMVIGGRLVIGSSLEQKDAESKGFERGVDVSGGIRLDGARIDADLEVNLLRLTHELPDQPLPVMLSLRKTSIKGSLEMREMVCRRALALDFTTASARVLGGNLKRGWGVCVLQSAWPILDGFRYEALDVMKDLKDFPEPVDDTAGIDWLDSQYADGQRSKDINLEPYQTLAKAFSQRGDLAAARSVLVAGIAKEWGCKPLGKHWYHVILSIFEKVLGKLYNFTFGFGYSAKKAIFTMLAYWLVGVGAVYLGNKDTSSAQRDSAFVVDAVSISAEASFPMTLNELLAEPSMPSDQSQEAAASAASAAASATSQTVKARIGPMVGASTGPASESEVSCGDEINPFVYALDVMVPLLDLRQESRCSIRSSNTWWIVLKALYAGIGAVVVSLGILTISGVLRRDLK